MSSSLEVAMRPPEVFVRELVPEEGARLKSISKRAKHQSKRARAMIVLASSTGMSAPQIAELLRTDESHVRKVIHAFNEQGFSTLDPDYRGGRPKKTTPEQRDRIVAVARARAARGRRGPGSSPQVNQRTIRRRSAGQAATGAATSEGILQRGPVRRSRSVLGLAFRCDKEYDIPCHIV
jgi:transposase